MTDSDTIVALSSAEGPGLRGIVRLSGPRAAEIVAAVFLPVVGRVGRLTPWPAGHYRACDGLLRVAGLEIPSSCYFMRAPRSYTREDVLEIHTISSAPFLALVLVEMTRHGARLAEPGEFTRRAFLHGRLDLTQAESVLSVIEAASKAELAAALRSLRGALGTRLRDLHRELVDLLAHIELALDFSDQEVETLTTPAVIARIRDVRDRIERFRQDGTGVSGRAPTVTLVGRPNVGKSSLLNRLLRQDRVLVDETPGTTRDVVEAPFHGSALLLADTPGVEHPSLGAPIPGADAELVVYVLDGSAGILPDDWALRAILQPAVVAQNKCDLPSRASPADLARFAEGAEVLATSALTGAGVDNLEKRLVDIVETRMWRTCGYLWINSRAAALLGSARTSLDRACEAFELGLSWEFPCLFLHQAVAPLSALLGEQVDESVLDVIFSRFCIGK